MKQNKTRPEWEASEPRVGIRQTHEETPRVGIRQREMT